MLFAAPSSKEDAAISYCDEHRAGWCAVWEQYGVPCDMAEAVVFPEVMRINLLMDTWETGAVKAMYTRKGTDGCDYSIGTFQMRPSFVEQLEKRWMRSGLARQYNLYFDTKDNETARRIRISRMEKEEWQCIYIAVFLKMLYLDYPVETLSKKEQVRVAATAYNHGCKWVNPGCGDITEIRSKCGEKHFHLAFVPGPNTKKYSYSDIAVRHWKRIR